MSAEAMTSAGLNVIETVDAALAILKDRREEIAAILSDIETPRARNGYGLAREVLETRPRLPWAADCRRRTQVRFIGKPYSDFEVDDLLLRLARGAVG